MGRGGGEEIDGDECVCRNGISLEVVGVHEVAGEVGVGSVFVWWC